jgi:hypothetical protein
MDCTVRGSNPGRDKRLFSKHKTSARAHPAYYSMGIRGNFPRAGVGDWLQHDIDHSMYLALRLRISGAIPLLRPPGLHFMDRDNFTITACFTVKCVRSLMPKDYGVLLNFYGYVHPSSKPLASKLTQ